MEKISRFEKTNIFIETEAEKLEELKTLEKVLDYLKAQIATRNLSCLHIDDSVHTLLPDNSWDQKRIIGKRRLIVLNDESDYKALIRREYAKYHLCEAVIRMAALVKIGQIDLPNNTGISIHLKHEKGLYPCMLRLFHYANDKIELRVKQVYNQCWFFQGESFLT
jgi:hypothetical protein